MKTKANKTAVTIVDVRTPAEFGSGHAVGSINIPLQEIPARIGELREMGAIVLCCASGNRSGQAAAYLRRQGIGCDNAGPWTDVEHFIDPSR